MNLSQNIAKTRTLGAYGPLGLAPAEGMGALWAPYLFVFFYYYFGLFCLFCLLVY